MAWIRIERHARRLTLVVLLLAVILALYAWGRRNPQDVPWGKLTLADRAGPFTVMKIGRLRADGAACRALLDAAGERFTPLKPVREGPHCGYSDAVRLNNGAGMDYAPMADVSCPLAAGLFLWEKQVLEPAALAHFGQSIAEVETLGVYSCRRIGGGAEGPYSEHATANAIDIAGFRLRDGRRIRVATDWRGTGAKAAFLRDVRDGACRMFGTTLSPDFNAAHRDHFHLDETQGRIGGFCR